MSARILAYGGLAACVAAAWSLEPGTPPPPEAAPAQLPPPPEPLAWPVAALPQLRPPLEPASHDPFRTEPPVPASADVAIALAAPVPAPAFTPAREESASAAEATPAAASPPQLNLSFVGSVRGADGALQILASDGEHTWSLAPGLELPSGFRVEEVSADAVQFFHPGAGVTARLVLPPTPAFELR